MVSVQSAKLDGMSDFREFKVTHWGLRNDPKVAEATIAYQQAQIRLQAALQATGMIASHSLLDFLR